MFCPNKIIKEAKKLQKTIVFPEADFSERIVEAGKILTKKKIVKVIFIGDESAMILKYKKLDGITIINPKTSSLTGHFIDVILEKRKDKGMTLKKAKELVINPVVFATLMVEEGLADGMVGGAETSTADNLRPALQLIKGKTKDSLISSCNIIYGKNKLLGKDKTMVIGDCGLNINPSSEELATISQDIANFARLLCGLDPKVALLSFSTKGSAETTETKKVSKAFDILKKKNTDFVFDGELQLDSAIVPRVAALKCPDSPLKGKANVLIFPEIQSGNITYKAIERFGGVNSFGPIMLGFKKPVNDLSRGCTVYDIIVQTAITSIQSKEEKN